MLRHIVRDLFLVLARDCTLELAQYSRIHAVIVGADANVVWPDEVANVINVICEEEPQLSSFG